MMNRNITNMVFSGGGMRGFAYIGVIRYLYVENLHQNIKHVAGTSIGAMFSLAFALKIPVEYLEDSYRKFINDTSNLTINKAELINLIYDCGLVDPRKYIECMKDYVKKTYKQDDLTFIELSKKTGINLYISCTNLNTNKNEKFCVDTTPDISIFEATAASISVPYLIKPVYINDNCYIDGGLTNNFPIDYFENVSIDNILGVVIRVESGYIPSTIENTNKLSIIDYSSQLASIIGITFCKSTIDKYIDKYKNNLVLITESHISSFIVVEIKKDDIFMNMSEDDLDIFIIQGYKITHDYFTKEKLH